MDTDTHTDVVSSSCPQAILDGRRSRSRPIPVESTQVGNFSPHSESKLHSTAAAAAAGTGYITSMNHDDDPLAIFCRPILFTVNNNTLTQRELVDILVLSINVRNFSLVHTRSTPPLVFGWRYRVGERPLHETSLSAFFMNIKIL